MTNQEFLTTLDSIIAERHALQHPFYQMWNDGALTIDMLQEYAKEYYLHVHNFPTYVSATHANCDDIKIRQMLLENLVEEEQGENNHPELWLRFGDSLGISREEMLTRNHTAQTKLSVKILKDLSKNENPAVGLAALYAYESQVPEVATTKIEGLKKHYNLDTEDALVFFQVHEHADEIHRIVTREALVELCQTDSQKEIALDATREAADALNLLLDGVYEKFCSSPSLN